jgi:ATP-dependent Lhr-like helicase
MPGGGASGTPVNNMAQPAFHPVIRNWFQANYKNLTPPQEQGWPVIAKGNHTLILAPTGSGKTLAAFLWCIDNLLQQSISTTPELFEKNQAGVHTLYISPLKALNNDIARNLRAPLAGILKHARQQNLNLPMIRVNVRTGDTTPQQRQQMLRKPPHILITTPESLYLLLTSKGGRTIFSQLRYVIVDEIHAVSGDKRGVHLSLSLERLMTLCKQEPVRIGLSATQKPLERIAAYLGGWIYDKDQKKYAPRTVVIVNCGGRKKINLSVKSPVDDFSDLPEASVWPQTVKLLYQEIKNHHTTLIFVNMRAQAERIARQLNEHHQRETDDQQVEIALAHHGSMSREMRFDVEKRLKEGRIPAVVATGSLELGIDIGSIDLVIQLQAPRTVAGAIQRIGRSGHLYSAESKGYIIPLYPADLDDAIALSQAVTIGAIEETVIPQNCLDVLAQQLVAEISSRSWPHAALYNLVRQSYCYHNLPERAFNQVLEMLGGAYANNPLPALQARISWDRVNDLLITRKGSGMVAIINGGTIPDRGYYGVYLSGTNTRLGEVEEEFVFESRPGDTFFLGNNEWLIEAISPERILVSAVRAVKPKAPFWKGGLAYRDYSTAKQICLFRESLVAKIEQNQAENWLNENFVLDHSTISNIIRYYKRQLDATGTIASHLRVIAENFRDSSGESNLVLHAPFGMRVNATWSFILSDLLEKKFQCQILYTYNDDGILLRLGEHAVDFPLKDLLAISPEQAEQHLLNQLPASYLFAITFRHNAMRALLLPRSQPNKRIPLWLQRLKAADLLQAVSKYPDFPIVVETYRECLQNIFNLDALKKILQGLKNGKIDFIRVDTSVPSPMTSGLLFNFLSVEMYDYDRVRVPAEAAAVSSGLLAELLDKKQVPALVTREIIRSYENKLQHLTVHSRAADEEAIFAIIEQLGPIPLKELQRRSKTDPTDWLKMLEKNHRIKEITEGYIAIERYNASLPSVGIERVKQNVRRLMRVHGPLLKNQIVKKVPFPQKDIEDALAKLEQERLLVKGVLLENSSREYWCDRGIFSQLYRQAVALRRTQSKILPFKLFYKFQFLWQKLGIGSRSLLSHLDRLRGFQLPITLWEREIFPVRMPAGFLDEFKNMVAEGKLILRHPAESNCICYHRRGEGNLFLLPPEPGDNIFFNFLKENSSCFFQDIIDGTNHSEAETAKALYNMLYKDQITCDNYNTMHYLLMEYRQNEQSDEVFSRRKTEQKIQGRMKLHQGRWYPTTAYSIRGKQFSPQEHAEILAELLLQRYGIVVKEWYRRENLPLPWYQLFQVLKRWEWQGKIRRGYFIDKLSGIQYALPETVTLIQEIQDGKVKDSKQTVLLSIIDPCLPMGNYIPWHLCNQKQEPVAITRSAGNHLILTDGLPVVYAENYGARLVTLADCTVEHFPGICHALKQLLKPEAPLRQRNKIQIETIDGKPPLTAPIAKVMLAHGFEQNGSLLTLWPSAL